MPASTNFLRRLRLPHCPSRAFMNPSSSDSDPNPAVRCRSSSPYGSTSPASLARSTATPFGFNTSLSGSVAAAAGGSRNGPGGLRVSCRGGIADGTGYEGSSRANRRRRWNTMRRFSESSSAGATAAAAGEEAAAVAGVKLWEMLVAGRWREKVCLREPALSLKTARSIFGGGRKSPSRRRPRRGSTAYGDAAARATRSDCDRTPRSTTAATSVPIASGAVTGGGSERTGRGIWGFGSGGRKRRTTGCDEDDGDGRSQMWQVGWDVEWAHDRAVRMPLIFVQHLIKP
jgi:hypothetical protein